MIVIVNCPIEKEDSTILNDNIYKKYCRGINDASNLSKEEFENMTNDNLKKASSYDEEDIDLKSLYNVHVYKKMNHKNEETIDDLKKNTSVYPDPKKCKTLYAKTKKGYKAKVYELMYIWYDN